MGTPATFDLEDRLRRKLLVDLLFCLIAGIGLAVFVGGPTWLSAGLPIAHLAATAVAGALGGRLLSLGRSEERPMERTMAITLIVTVVWTELIRLGLVLWSGLDAVDAAWAGVWEPVLGLVPLLFVLLSGGLRRPTRERPPGTDGVPGSEAAPATEAVPDPESAPTPDSVPTTESPPGRSDASRGRPLGPRRLVFSAGSFAGHVAPWLLVAWSPLLAVVTFAVPVGVGLLELRSARLDELRMDRKEGLRAASGYLLMALALALWLIR